MRKIFLGIFVLVVFSQSLCAETVSPDSIRKTIEGLFPDVNISRVQLSEISGLYEVLMGTEVIYVSTDGQFLMRGDLIDLIQRRNLSEEIRSASRIDILKEIPESEVIEFAPKQTQNTVYVFTDIDCGYCRRLHKDVPELNRKGIAVRYLAFPRAGEGSASFRNMESIWCAEDRNQAMTDAKNGKSVKSRKCMNPVKQQYLLGQTLGVRGTPAMYLEDGRQLPGYMPPDKLLQAINHN